MGHYAQSVHFLKTILSVLCGMYLLLWMYAYVCASASVGIQDVGWVCRCVYVCACGYVKIVLINVCVSIHICICGVVGGTCMSI